MVMPHTTTTTTRIAPTIAPTGGVTAGMKKLKVMLHSWSCGRVGLIQEYQLQLHPVPNVQLQLQLK